MPWSAFEAVLPESDLFLYDFKHPDSAKHRELTGCGNGRIKENLLRLGKTGKPIEIRIPLIPGLNMDDGALAKSARFLSGVGNLTGIRLLPYHALARSKYETVGRSDTMPDAAPPDAAALNRAAELLNRAGVRILLPGGK
ncbi:Pyruvate formate-lyase-activating enzyme [bioreactor metagenome]|uniref:Pyruvate formate-lyase-activating enzyme n=1 Tax=bioreactor metagenome TaxID=1076179 RepID=A0A645EKD8_9ZZZZ